jgi:membrane protein implicated in regulation of membrane protease activity
MKPFTLLLTSLMIIVGFILIVFGCVFGYASIKVHAIMSYNLWQLTVNCVLDLIVLVIGVFLFYKGIKLIKKKN